MEHRRRIGEPVPDLFPYCSLTTNSEARLGERLDSAKPPVGPPWIGVGLAMIALLVYSVSESGALSFVDSIKAVFHFTNTHLAVQVLLEDIAIGVLFVRVAAALQPRWAILLVAALFAAGHLPALFASGASAGEMLGLVRDFALGVLVIGILWRGADIIWFWPVHFVLDMTQFLGHAH